MSSPTRRTIQLRRLSAIGFGGADADRETDGAELPTGLG